MKMIAKFVLHVLIFFGQNDVLAVNESTISEDIDDQL